MGYDRTMSPFLPTSPEEMQERGWDQLDVLLVSGDAYVDHPSFGTALIGRLRLEPLGANVLPHENTLTGPRADRLEMDRATKTQFGQDFGLYPDPES